MSTQFSLPPRNEQTSFGSASFPPLSGTARSTVGMLDANPDHDNFEMGDASGRPGTPPTSGLPFGSQVLGNPFGSIDDSFMAPPATHMQSFAGVTIVPSASYSSNADSIGTAAFGTSSSQAPLGTAAFGTSNLGSGPIAESELEQPGSAVLPYRSMPPVQTEKQPVAMVSQAKSLPAKANKRLLSAFGSEAVRNQAIGDTKPAAQAIPSGSLATPPGSDRGLPQTYEDAKATTPGSDRGLPQMYSDARAKTIPSTAGSGLLSLTTATAPKSMPAALPSKGDYGPTTPSVPASVASPDMLLQAGPFSIGAAIESQRIPTLPPASATAMFDKASSPSWAPAAASTAPTQADVAPAPWPAEASRVAATDRTMALGRLHMAHLLLQLWRPATLSSILPRQ